MTTFSDYHIFALLGNTRSKGNFGEFIERETGYSWNGGANEKLSLLEHMTENASGEHTQIETIESSLLPILTKMELQGVVLDTEKLQEIGKRIQVDMKACETEIYDITREFFNLNSPKQVAEILFGKLGIKPTKKNKTGYSVDTEVLEEIAKEYDIARLIIEYRSLSKLQSTYIEALGKAADKKTQRIHTTYSQIGAATGRMSSNDPNLQNIPTGSGYASEIKSCFIPSPGNTFLVADYSQIELRVLAWLSQDRALLEAFEKNEDIHMRTARFLFPEHTDITSEQRRIAKTVNFGVIYGITGFGLAKTLGTSPWEAEQYIHAFYEKYPGVRSYYETILEEGRTSGYVETAFGRKRFIPALKDSNKTIRSVAEREAINMPIQGTAADMLKLAMIDIDANIRKNNVDGAMILQVHDELVFDIPVSSEHIWRTIIQDAMENVLMHHKGKLQKDHRRVPIIKVDIHEGRNWQEAKG